MTLFCGLDSVPVAEAHVNMSISDRLPDEQEYRLLHVWRRHNEYMNHTQHCEGSSIGGYDTSDGREASTTRRNTGVTKQERLYSTSTNEHQLGTDNALHNSTMLMSDQISRVIRRQARFGVYPCTAPAAPDETWHVQRSPHSMSPVSGRNRTCATIV